MLEADQCDDDQLEDNFKLVTEKVNNARNVSVKELSQSNDHKRLEQGTEGTARPGVNTSRQDGSIDKLGGSAQDSNSKVVAMPVARQGSKLDENLLIEEYGNEDEDYDEDDAQDDQLERDYSMGNEQYEDHEEDVYFEQEYERAIATSKKKINKESLQSIQVRSVTKKDSVEKSSQKDLSFNELSGSMKEENSPNNKLAGNPHKSSVGGNLRIQTQQNGVPISRGSIGEKLKSPQVKISKRIAKTHDEDFEGIGKNVPPMKVTLPNKAKAG